MSPDRAGKGKVIIIDAVIGEIIETTAVLKGAKVGANLRAKNFLHLFCQILIKIVLKILYAVTHK